MGWGFTVGLLVGYFTGFGMFLIASRALVKQAHAHRDAVRSRLEALPPRRRDREED